MSGAKLQSLYNDLFGSDDQDEVDGVAEAPDPDVQLCMPGYGLHANGTAIRPAVTFDKPTGLLLFRSWMTHQQQASM